MSAGGAADATGLSIGVVERETGLTKDVLRKWETRYGFPAPGRDLSGERVYPLDQVDRLRVIKRLLDSGLRPSQVVNQPPDSLAEMTGRNHPADAASAVVDEFEAAFLLALREHDAPVLRRSLRRALYREGLQRFVQDRMALMIRLVGEAWARGELDIHEEHFFSELLQGVLRSVIDDLNDERGEPRILLTTPPGEPHGLGLLMAASLAALEGAYCLSLGTQTPLQEIRNAVVAREMDVVALSFSSTFPARQIPAVLEQLRAILPPRVSLWAGGDGARRIADDSGVEVVGGLSGMAIAIGQWRGTVSNRSRPDEIGPDGVVVGRAPGSGRGL